jgi:hypothetical protein
MVVRVRAYALSARDTARVLLATVPAPGGRAVSIGATHLRAIELDALHAALATLRLDP